jgi:flagellar M-ring protein FliF
MNARVQQMLQQLSAFFLGLPPARRMVVAGAGIVSMAMVLGLAWWVQRPLYRPLFTNLGERDASQIVEALKAEKVPYTLDDGGRAVLVPGERLYELRLALASRGLPEGGGVGFELFDRQTLGQTDFLQRLNYQRALQGELGRTIGQLGGVESARVHVAIPERSLFVAADRRPSASVVLRLAPGRALARAQIDGIVHLVASSVEGMDAANVTVVDEAGRMLTPEHRGGESGTSSDALDMQRTIERQMEERIESLLAAAVGREKVLARVTATLDFSRVERTEETYDPDKSVLRTARTTKEETLGAHGPGGAPGVQANLTNDAAAVPEGQAPKSTRKDESTSYEVSKVVSRTILPVGAVKQLSVAVLVDGTYGDGTNGEKSFTPRPAEELERLKEVVKSAVGFSEARGDRLELTSVAFQTAAAEPGESALAGVMRWAPAVLVRLLGVAVGLALLLFVVRPMLLTLATRVGTGGRRAALGAPVAAATAQLTHENLQLTQQSPERAAQLVREWLREGAAAGPLG